MASPIQIIGTAKCQDTRATMRFFKERRVAYHFVDLAEREMSPGEFESVKRAAGIANMIDREGKEFQRLGLAHQRFDIETKLKENQRLLRTPIVRNGRLATVGFQPDIWKQWLAPS